MRGLGPKGYETAIRRGELLKLTPGDLNLEERFLCVVDGKEGSRDVPLTRRAVELLEGLVGGCAVGQKCQNFRYGFIQRYTGCQTCS